MRMMSKSEVESTKRAREEWVYERGLDRGAGVSEAGLEGNQRCIGDDHLDSTTGTPPTRLALQP